MSSAGAVAAALISVASPTRLRVGRTGVVIQRPDPRRTTVRQITGRNPGRTDTDLELERRGKMSDLTAEERSAFILVAERLGCHTAAQHIRDDQRRRDRVHAAPAPTPLPGPKPKRTPPKPGVMNLVQGGGELFAPVPQAPGADAWPAAIGEVVAGAERGMAMPGLRPDDRDRLMEIRTLARLAGRLPARELREADPTRPLA